MERTSKKLSEQIKERANKPSRLNYQNETKETISTGSTLLDLAISGGMKRGGGIPGGILVEIFGPASAGKTVMLCEIAGSVQRQGGQVMFRDPEARLNKEFAKLFGLDVETVDYDIPSTVPEVFKPVREWDPEPEGKIHGIFADSLAALSTSMELEDKDQYGMRRAKEFSEECRKTCRVLAEKGFLMVCSNQIRQNLDAGPYGQKYKTPGGEAIGFYASLRLRCGNPQKIKVKKKIKGKEHSKVIGVETEVEVFKSSIWEPHHTATIYIIYDYGIDDIQANLRFLKKMTADTVYSIGERKLSKSIDEAIAIVEEEGLENELREEVIDLWEEMEIKFKQDRKQKQRYDHGKEKNNYPISES